MNNLKAHFDRVGYQPKYYLGDRVRGTWNKIPFSGTVAIDTVISEADGPFVRIFLDLPIKYKKVVYYIITCRHRDVKLLK